METGKFIKIYLFGILTLFTLHVEFIDSAEICPAPNHGIDCLLKPDPTQSECENKGCIWCPPEAGGPSGAPSCVLPSTYGYRLVSQESSDRGITLKLTKASTLSYFGKDSQDITIEFIYDSNYRLRIKVTDGTDRYQVPLLVSRPPIDTITDKLYEIQHSPPGEEVFWFKILRKTPANPTGTVIFDTSMGGLTFSDQFLQFSTKLPSTNSYGFGENEQKSFRHNFQQYSTFPMFARSQAPEDLKNLYGVQPYYTVVEPDGNTHSVMIVNSNAQEVTLTPAPGFVYRTIGGILDLYLFMGPTPEETSQQFTEAVGRQSIPPYWGLGFQLSRWGYNDIETMRGVVDEMRSLEIPQDVQYGDIDIMDRTLDFTYDQISFEGLPEYVMELKGRGVKFVTILDPGISKEEPEEDYRPYKYGNELDVWMKRPDGTPMVGRVWPGFVHFPDFSKGATRTWWVTLIKEFHAILPFDGLWIDMNEPASWAEGDSEQPGCDENNPLNYPPYMPDIVNGQLFEKTACPDHQQEFGLHYNTHSLYGWSQSEPTLAGVREAIQKRSLVLSRSTFLGSGKWAAHWLGDNYSRWSNLHYSIIGMLQFNHFGIPYVGADICGFFEDATEELCVRWQQLGSFYPFARNHNINSTADQHPSTFSPDAVSSIKAALNIRYTLLPYLYTLFYKHRTEGNTVIRALWHEFPTDSNTLGIDKQFLWGSGLMICPVLEEKVVATPAYFPDARWYSYQYSYETHIRKETAIIMSALDHIPVFMRGGIIYPTQQPGLNTQETRVKPFGIIVALDDDAKAIGEIYFDDGDSIDPQDTGLYFRASYSAEQNGISSTVIHNGYGEMAQRILDTIRILGVKGKVESVKLNNVEWTEFRHNQTTGEVYIQNLGQAMTSNFAISYVVDENGWPTTTSTTPTSTTPASTAPTTTPGHAGNLIPCQHLLTALVLVCAGIFLREL